LKVKNIILTKLRKKKLLITSDVETSKTTKATIQDEFDAMRNFIYDNMPKSQENIKTIKVHRRNKSELKSYKES